MSVEQFDPKQTTTLETSAKVLKEQSVMTPSTGSRIGFVSLGCPKNLVDSERILTQLRIEGYDVVATYADADMVIVNTCGFIDSAVQESLDTIGEALAENGANSFRTGRTENGQQDAVEVLGGTIPADLMAQFDGKKVVNMPMKNGLNMYMVYDGNITDMTFRYRLFTWYGVTIKDPSRVGVATTS